MEPLRTSQTPSFGLKPILDFVDFFGTFSEKYFSQWPRMADLAPPPEAAAPQGGPWGPMGAHGAPWAPMGPYGALWGPHGAPWGPMGSPGPYPMAGPYPCSGYPQAMDSRAGWREALFTLVISNKNQELYCTCRIEKSTCSD